ncbi:MAG: hypothetical protein A3H93_02175 [Rhodocyclales bacterium RIFCSPLOWO2_02_FULL_63_24]|nr:MAG: hypothetical protein A3H93_02175 [Rhodocyclales bacterium RIFCSPLOWO2_02_FULL_63_24]
MAEDLTARDGADTAAVLRPGLLDLFRAFFQVGLTSFGMAILHNLRTTALRLGFVSAAEIEEDIALVQLYPGPIMVDLVAFIGYHVAGLAGALAATLAIFAPSVVMTMLFTELFVHVRHLAPIRAAIRGVMATFVGMLVWVAISLGRPLAVQPAAWLLAAAAVAALRFLKWDTLRLFAAGLLLWAAVLQAGLV